jgi:hypothetical protein
LHRGGEQCCKTNALGCRQRIKPQILIPDITLNFLPSHCDASVELYLYRSILQCIKHKQSPSLDQRKGSTLHWVRVWGPLGAAFATRQTFSRFSQIDQLIVWLIIFKTCRFSNALFLNLGATGLRSEWRARAPQRKPSEGYFFEPRLRASHPLCPNSISVCSAYKYIKYSVVVYCKM